MAARPAGRHTSSGGDNVPGAQEAVDEPPDDEEVEVDDVLDEDDALVELELDEDVGEPSFFAPPSPDGDSAGFDALVDDDERESVL